MPVVPSYQTRLPQKVIPRCVTVGRFDGRSDTLACAAPAGRIMLLGPGAGAGAKSGGSSSRVLRPEPVAAAGAADVMLLNMGQAVTALAAGRLGEPATSPMQDLLLVGSAGSCLAYDVLNNADAFFRDAPDGVSAIVVGRLGRQSGVGQLALVGGNCSLTGYDRSGNDVFWSVTGDNVSSLSLCDFLGSGGNELLVGSEDYEIRVFQDDEIVQEITETEVVSCLCAIQGPMFAYGLANGTIDPPVAHQIKEHPVAVFAFDLDSDGVPELITGWSNGKIDARNCRTGEVVFKDQFPSSVAGIVAADFRKDGTKDSKVRSFDPVPTHLRATLLETTGVDSASSVHSLMQTRQNLQLELHNYEENAKAQLQQQRQLTRTAAPAAAEKLAGSSGGGGGISGLSGAASDTASAIPANTQVQTSLSVDLAHKPAPCVCLRVATTNSTAIRAVIVFAEGIFDGESHPARGQPGHPAVPQQVRQRGPAPEVPGGPRGATQFHVFETTRSLPRFAVFAPVAPEAAAQPAGFVRFRLQERLQRVAMWINANFLLAQEVDGNGGPLDCRFVSMATGEALRLWAESDKMVIGTDNMELAGELVTALAGYLGLEDLASEAEFPGLADSLKSLVDRISEFEAQRQRLSGDMADSSNLVRAPGGAGGGRQAIGRFCELKKGLQALSESLKALNQIIQRAGRLRAGRFKTQAVNDCRAAVKASNLGALHKIIRSGSA
uniref:Bardet-Biedl syndrome 2 protein homolog n=1 Tax=Macrostomum lignano TaxID=282301 RepID=A0A1I8HC79_9PLAT